MEIKRSNNFILSRLVPQLDKHKAKVTLGYKHGDPGVMIESKNLDTEGVAMFGLGLAFELFEIAKGDELFNKAFEEGVRELLRRVENEK